MNVTSKLIDEQRAYKEQKAQNNHCSSLWIRLHIWVWQRFSWNKIAFRSPIRT